MKQIQFYTWAQCETPVHAGFWRNMKEYARHLDADIHVMLGTYKHNNNPYAIEDVENKWWASEVIPYDLTQAHEVTPDLTCRFDVRISPTATNPLSGLHLLSHHRSVIIGHPRYHSHCLPAGNAVYPKVQTTTGACTMANYSDTKVGLKAHENHIYGFVIVELDNDYYHIRHVNARSRDGAFIDSARGLEVKSGKVGQAPPAQSLRLGDAHAMEQCETAIQASLSMRDICRPERIIVDDIYSHSAAGHRLERDNYAQRIAKHNRQVTVYDELMQSIQLMRRLGATDVMYSNHHVMLDEWLANTDARHDPANLSVWSKLLAYKATHPDTPAYEAWCTEVMYALGWDIPTFWRRGQACVIGNVLNDHGHEGVNGTRGTANGWRKYGSKITTAHTHSPRAADGHYCAGHTSDPSQHHYADVTKSGWLQANIMQDAYGKRQIINIIKDSNGKFLGPHGL